MNRPLSAGAWALMTLAALGVAGYAVAMVLLPLTRGDFVEAMFRDTPVAAPAHLAGGAVAIVAGAFQFSETLRRRWLQWHRWTGRTYVTAVAISGIAAISMAITTPGGLAAQWGFSMLGLAWLIATGMAYLRIRQRDVAAHRRWMVRSYALTLAAVSLRIYLPLALARQVPFENAYAAIAWLCWVPNLLLAEWLILPLVERRPAR